MRILPLPTAIRRKAQPYLSHLAGPSPKPPEGRLAAGAAAGATPLGAAGAAGTADASVPLTWPLTWP